MDNSNRLIRHPGLAPLWAGLEREHRMKQFAAVVLLLFGLGLIFFSLRYSPIFPLLGATLVTFSLWWLYRLLSEQPAAYWRERLRSEPEVFVWVYGMLTERMPFGINFLSSATLYLVEADGTAHDFSLHAKELLLVSKTLNRLLPHAEFGYTENRDLKYRGKITRPKQ